MIALKARLEEELKKALKARNELRVSALREALGALSYAEIDKKKSLSDSEQLEVLSKLKKRHLESITAFKAGERGDLVEKEEGQLKVIEEFLPKMLTPEEITQLVKEAIIALEAKGIKEMGKVMAWLKDKYLGRADGRTVSEEVKKQLSELAE